MSERAAKTRVSVTVTKAYIEALDYLLDEGVYLSRGDAILEALRLLFGAYGIAPFYPERAELQVDKNTKDR